MKERFIISDEKLKENIISGLENKLLTNNNKSEKDLTSLLILKVSFIDNKCELETYCFKHKMTYKLYTQNISYQKLYRNISNNHIELYYNAYEHSKFRMVWEKSEYFTLANN